MNRADFGSTDSEPVLSDFTLEIKLDLKHKNLIDRALRILPVELIESEGSNFKLKYRVLFEPLKAFSDSVELIVYCKRGRWRVVIDLEATDPVPDDSISLTAAVGGIDKVGFRLSNRFLGFSTFQARFTAKSSSHFSVTPSSGVLAPYGVEGTPFVISFAPLSYGAKEMYVTSCHVLRALLPSSSFLLSPSKLFSLSLLLLYHKNLSHY